MVAEMKRATPARSREVFLEHIELIRKLDKEAPRGNRDQLSELCGKVKQHLVIARLHKENFVPNKEEDLEYEQLSKYLEDNCKVLKTLSQTENPGGKDASSESSSESGDGEDNARGKEAADNGESEKEGCNIGNTETQQIAGNETSSENGNDDNASEISVTFESNMIDAIVENLVELIDNPRNLEQISREDREMINNMPSS